MAKDFLEMITEVIVAERLGDELKKDVQYKAAIAEEQRLYEILDASLNEEQQAILKNYFDACSGRESIVENTVYRLGMKDLLSLFRSLSPMDESKLQKIDEEYANKRI
jgi:hypothetical protein